MASSSLKDDSNTLWRRVAASSWDDPRDPTVFGKLEFDVTDLEPLLSRLADEFDVKCTVTALFAWLWARTLMMHPAANCIVRNREIQKLPSVALGIAVALPKSDQVWLIRMDNENLFNLGYIEFARELRKEVERVSSVEMDNGLSEQYSWVTRWVPGWLINSLLQSFTTLETDWGFDVSRIGIKRDPFRPVTATITAPGMLGVREGYPAFSPLQPTMCIMFLGEIHVAPFIVENPDGTPVVAPRRVLNACFTMDHRVIDGKLGGNLIRTLKRLYREFLLEYFAEPAVLTSKSKL